MNETSESVGEVKGRVKFSRLLQIAAGKKRLLFVSIALAIVSAIAQFVPMVVVYLLVLELARQAGDLAGIDAAYVWRLAWIALGSVGVYGILIYTASMFSHVAAFNILYEMRVALAEKLTRLPLGYFTRKATGAIKKVLAEDVERVELFVAHHIPDLATAIAFPIITIVFLFVVDWRLAIPALIPMPLAIFVQGRMQSKHGERWMALYTQSLARANATIVEYVRGMPVVKVFNRTGEAYRRLTEDVNGLRNACKGMAKEYAVYPAYLTALSSPLAFILPVSIYLITRAADYETMLSTVLLFLVLGGSMFFSMYKLMWMAGILRQIMHGVGEVDGILNGEEIHESPSPKLPKNASVEFAGVGFAYEKAAVLSDVTFAVPEGTLTALVGPSGGGKTTIARLIPRFWDVARGEVRVGGVNVREIDVASLMDRVAFVFQDTMLFYDTIEENIRMGNRDASTDAVIRAAEAAQCSEFIDRLPGGYGTFIGEGGTYLSGGEAQRISLARAILKDAPIVVLDEATAYADPDNEGKILAAFAELAQGKTVIVIAHRLSTVVDADQILVIDHGEIRERGRHGELLALDGLYARMWDSYAKSRDWALTIKPTEVAA